MKYAVPVAGGALSSHFGHCEQFAIFDVDDTNKQISGKSMVTPPPHEPGVFPKWLAGQGVNTVIAGGMGGRAIQLFQENNIDVVTGSMESDPEKAVLSHISGSLEFTGETCSNDHHSHNCDH